MIIRSATSEDVSAIVAIQQKNPQAAQWQESEYARLMEAPSGVLLVAEDATGQVQGFAAAQRVADEAELQNLAVDPERRRHGVGQALLDGVHCQLRAVGTRRVYLEVRPSNESALALYHFCGYTIVARRKDYYAAPPEDALVLSTSLGGSKNEEPVRDGAYLIAERKPPESG
jgi:ribosomal-protein-alanine N-acetyltransferase